MKNKYIYFIIVSLFAISLVTPTVWVAVSSGGFIDTFDRADNNDIGTNWTEVQGDSQQNATIRDNFLRITDGSTSNLNLIANTNVNDTHDSLEVSINVSQFIGSVLTSAQILIEDEDLNVYHQIRMNKTQIFISGNDVKQGTNNFTIVENEFNDIRLDFNWTTNITSFSVNGNHQGNITPVTNGTRVGKISINTGTGVLVGNLTFDYIQWGSQLSNRVILESPIEGFNSPYNSVELSCSAISYDDNLINASIFVDGIRNFSVVETDNDINITSTIQGLSIGQHNWTCRAYNTTNDAFIIANRTFNVSNFVTNSQTFNSSTLEGNIEPFSINITFNKTIFTNSQVRLNYNNTFYSTTTTQTGDNRVYNTTAIAPNVATKTNVSFYWEVNLINGSSNKFNTTLTNQTVNIIAIDDCSSYSILLLNYSLKDEQLQTVINGVTFNTSVEVDVDIYSVGGVTPIIEYSQNYSKNNNPQVCLQNDLGSSTYQMDVQTIYGGDQYANEFNHIQNFTLSNSTLIQNIDLLDLVNTSSQEFKISFKDSNFLAVEDALIQIQRKYINEGVFKTVEIPKTDKNGETLAHLELNDVIYTMIVSKNGENLGTFDNIVAVCQNPTLNNCEINFNSFSTSIQPNDYTIGNDFSFTFSYAPTTRTITSIFSIPSGSTGTVLLNTTLFDGLGKTEACSDSLTSSSGTLTCIVPATLGNGTVIAKIFKDGALQGEATISLDQEPEDVYGVNIIFLSLIIIVSLIGIGVQDNPMITGVFILLAAGSLILFNLVDTNTSSFIGSGATILWLVIAIILVLIKGAKRI